MKIENSTYFQGLAKSHDLTSLLPKQNAVKGRVAAFGGRWRHFASNSETRAAKRGSIVSFEFQLFELNKTAATISRSVFERFSHTKFAPFAKYLRHIFTEKN